MLKQISSHACISFILLGSAIFPSTAATAAKLTTQSQDHAILLTQYQQLLSNAKEAAVIINYLDQHIAKVNREQADSMLLGLEAFYQVDLAKIQQHFFNQNLQDQLRADYDWKTSTLRTKDSQLQKLNAAMLAGKYKLTVQEGDFFPIVDYRALKKYSPYLSDEVKDYFALKALESDKRWLNDNAIVIPLDELAARVIAAETYLTKYPQAKMKKAATEIYLEYLHAYLYGRNNTPAFDFDTFRLRKEVLASFNKTVKTYPNSAVAKVVQGYLSVLKKYNYQAFRKVGGHQTNIAEVEKFKQGIHQQVLQDIVKKQSEKHPASSTNRYVVAGIENPREFEAFFEKVKQLVAKGDKAGVASYVAYPIQVYSEGKKVSISTQEQFIHQYDQILNSKVRNALQNQKVDQTFVNYQGVMVGNGELWLNVSPTNQHQFFITAINN